MRVVRAVVGVILLLAGVPLLFVGGGLWFALQHRDPSGGYSASLSEITTDGYAVVVSDVDGLLRREAPFARAGRTTLRITGHTDTGPAFVGLGPAGDVAEYLAGVPYARVEQVRLARGPLPVAATPVAGTAAPAAPPHQQPFWLATGGAGRPLEWSPSEVRGQQLALVIMDPRARAPLRIELTAQVRPEWLPSTAWALLVLGAILVAVAVAALAWPSRVREVVYVVPPAQVSEVAARLGVHLPASDSDWLLAPPPVASLAPSAPALSPAPASAPPTAPASASPPESASAPPPESASAPPDAGEADTGPGLAGSTPARGPAHVPQPAAPVDDIAWHRDIAWHGDIAWRDVAGRGDRAGRDGLTGRDGFAGPGGERWRDGESSDHGREEADGRGEAGDAGIAPGTDDPEDAYPAVPPVEEQGSSREVVSPLLIWPPPRANQVTAIPVSVPPA